MRLESILLRNFRNHTETLAGDFGAGINVLSGQNGAGKTSILEALSLSALSKSFQTTSDATLIRSGEHSLNIDARFRSDAAVGYVVRTEIKEGPPLHKTILANNQRIRAASDLIGEAPVVILTPDDRQITHGSPQERRRFLSMVLSQASRTYLEDELEYRRALKHRNAILIAAKQERRGLAAIASSLEPWTMLLIAKGVKIMERRCAFIKEFRPFLLESYAEVSESREAPSMTYLPLGIETESADFDALFTSALTEVRQEELRRGTSLAGPHRDELRLNVDADRQARIYASQGQHKTLLVSMKLAEYRYLEEAVAEKPMLLLDDVFSELDAARAARFLALAQNGAFGQTFITTTEEARFRELLPSGASGNRFFEIAGGKIIS